MSHWACLVVRAMTLAIAQHVISFKAVDRQLASEPIPEYPKDYAHGQGSLA